MRLTSIDELVDFVTQEINKDWENLQWCGLSFHELKRKAAHNLLSLLRKEYGFEWGAHFDLKSVPREKLRTIFSTYEEEIRQ